MSQTFDEGSVYNGSSRRHDPWLKLDQILCQDFVTFKEDYPFLSSGQYSWRKISGFIDPVVNGRDLSKKISDLSIP
ncbi:5343_t:CDS:2 [Funneliformis geosporum]|uniref:11181_t:CDS:1 n=1 Tax=Funneliformis geosporum TaxID=1117311 RepID=A0A9W4SGG1_9GLOM|nr:5343_t:CDS:2 [Funneliformis geosporum]CAI2168674.1 11181_t:CDS:2 [Funneliformis geosporum]